MSFKNAKEFWDASAAGILKSASEGPIIALNKVLLQKINDNLPFSSSTGVLDTGCGAAQILGSLLQNYGAMIPPDTRLVAADLSPAMIDIVNGLKIKEVAAGNAVWDRVEAVVCDAHDLAGAGIPDEHFSHVTAGLLLFTVERPSDVLAESLRVLKSNGGVFGMTSFHSAGWVDLVEEALSSIKPGTKLPRISDAWATTEGVTAQLEKAGFKDVIAEEVRIFSEFEDAEAMARKNITNIPSARVATAEMTEDELERAISWIIKWAGDRFPGGRGKLEAVAIVATGRK